jgi:CRP-like cAMP-binding protein
MLLVEKVFLLKSIEIFAQTPEPILIDVAEIIKEQEVVKGTVLFNQGDNGNCMYIIASGEVKIHTGDTTFATLGENDFFGELTLLDPEPRSASATVISDALLLVINEDAFYELMSNRIEVVKGIVKVLCRRLRGLNKKLQEK